MTAATEPPVIEQIVAAMREHEAEHPEGFTGYQIAQAVGVPFPTFYRALRRLESVGVVVSWRDDETGGQRYRRVTP